MGRKSAKIAAKKGAADKARGQVFTRALKDVFLASKSGSGDPDTNFLLKVAIDRCKKFNVPKMERFKVSLLCYSQFRQYVARN